MDVETYEDNKKVVPYLFVLKTIDSFHSFYEDGEHDIIAEFLNKVEQESNRLGMDKVEIFTHNINFDGFILIEYFLSKSIPFKWFIRQLNLYYLDLDYKGRSLRIRCSYKILGASVKKLGDILSEPKRSFPYKFMSKNNIKYKGSIPSQEYFENENEYLDFKKIWKEYIDIKEVSIKYAFYDVLIVYKALNEVFQISYIKYFKNSFSFSSYSYKLFVKKFDHKKVSSIKLNVGERNYIENSYYGGRTEIFGNTKNGVIHRFDFPGMYGSCMLESFPYGDPNYETPNNFDKPGFYTVTVKSDLEIPLLPIRTKNKILYPNGVFTTCLSRDEFVLFLEKGGTVDKIHSALTFPKEGYIFKDFVEKFDKIKEKGGFYKLYGKQVINSLYGSFALRKDDIDYIILYTDNELDFLQKEKRLKYYSKHNNIIIAGIESMEDLNQRENRNIAFASFISSKARIKLHKNVYAVNDYYKSKFGDSYKLLYLETDSIDISLPTSCLGDSIMDVCWQKIYKGGVYISPKFYALADEKPKIKGIRHSNYDFDSLSDSFYNNEDYVVFKKQLFFDKKNFILEQKYIDKILKISNYDKRTFSENKLETKSKYIYEKKP